MFMVRTPAGRSGGHLESVGPFDELDHDDEANCEGDGVESVAHRAVGVEAVRSGDSRRELFSDGSFSITNIGAMGLTGGLPLPNPPQVAILGVSSTRRAPVVIDETIQIRTIATLTLALDHRAVEGMVSAQFLAATRQRLETVALDGESSA